MAEVWEGSESDPSHLAEIEAEQRRLCGLRCDLDPRDALQIAAVLVVRAPLARIFMQPRERRGSRPLIANVFNRRARPAAAGHPRHPLEPVTHHETSFSRGFRTSCGS